MAKKATPSARFLETPIEPFVVEPGLTADQIVARLLDTIRP